MKMKLQEELEALKKSQQNKNEAWKKMHQEMDNLISFLSRSRVTQRSRSKPDAFWDGNIVVESYIAII